jgi:hypothetical protein
MTHYLSENPELVRYIRVHTRKGKATSYYTLFLVLCLACVVVNLVAWQYYGAYRSLETCFRSVFFQIVGANFLLLLVVGSHACGESVAQERQSNTLEFQRITGMNPYVLALGKILGVPLVHYLLAVVGMPFTMLCVLSGGVSILGFVAAYLVLAASGLFFSSLSTLMSSFRRETSSRGKTSPVVLVIMLLWMGPWFFMATIRGPWGSALLGRGANVLTCLLPFHSLYAVAQGDVSQYRVALFGVEVNGVLMTLVLNLLLFLFFWAGTARRIGSDSRPVWSKAQLLAGSLVTFGLLAGVLWDALPSMSVPRGERLTALAVCTLLAHAVLLLVATVASPNLYPYRVALRRRGAGNPAPAALLDERTMALPLTVLLAGAFAALALAVTTFRSVAVPGVPAPAAVALFLLPFVLCAVLYTGLVQMLRFFAPENGAKLQAVILFVWTALPLVGGTILLAMEPKELWGTLGRIVLFLSPVGACINGVTEGVGATVESPEFWFAVVVFAAAGGWLWSVLGRFHRRLVEGARGAASLAGQGGDGLTDPSSG